MLYNRPNTSELATFVNDEIEWPLRTSKCFSKRLPRSSSMWWLAKKTGTESNGSKFNCHRDRREENRVRRSPSTSSLPLQWVPATTVTDESGAKNEVFVYSSLGHSGIGFWLRPLMPSPASPTMMLKLTVTASTSLLPIPRRSVEYKTRRVWNGMASRRGVYRERFWSAPPLYLLWIWSWKLSHPPPWW